MAAQIKGQAVTLDITIEQHSDFELTLTLQGNNDVAQDLTGYTAKMQIRHRLGSEKVLIELTDGSGITLGGVNGTIAIVIADTTTAEFEWTTAKYDLVIDSGTAKTRIVQGTVTNSKGITE